MIQQIIFSLFLCMQAHCVLSTPENLYQKVPYLAELHDVLFARNQNAINHELRGGLSWPEYEKTIWDNGYRDANERKHNALTIIDSPTATQAAKNDAWYTVRIQQACIDLNDDFLQHRAKIMQMLIDQDHQGQIDQQHYDAATTIQSIVRKNIACNNVEKLREQQIIAREQQCMQQAEVATRSYREQEKKEANRKRKEAKQQRKIQEQNLKQAESHIPTIAQMIIDELIAEQAFDVTKKHTKQILHKHKKQQARDEATANVKAEQLAQERAKQEKLSADKKAAQEKEALAQTIANIILEEVTAQQASQLYSTTIKNMKKQSAKKLAQATSPTSANIVHDINNTDDDMQDIIQQLNQVCGISTIQSTADEMAEKNFQSMFEYSDFIHWRNQLQRDIDQAQAFATEQYAQQHHNAQHSQEQRWNIIHDRMDNIVQEKNPFAISITNLLEKYEQLLNKNDLSLDDLEKIEAEFTIAEKNLNRHNQHVRWYLANSPYKKRRIPNRILEMHVQKYVLEAHLHTTAQSLKKPNISQHEKLLLETQLNQLLVQSSNFTSIMNKIQSFHAQDGYLHIAQLDNPQRVNLDDQGVLTAQDITTAHQEILQCLQLTNIDLKIIAWRHIAPIIVKLAAKANLSCSQENIANIFEGAAAIAITKNFLATPESLNFMQATMYENQRKEHALYEACNQEFLTPNQRADSIKIHMTTIEAFLANKNLFQK